MEGSQQKDLRLRSHEEQEGQVRRRKKRERRRRREKDRQDEAVQEMMQMLVILNSIASLTDKRYLGEIVVHEAVD